MLRRKVGPQRDGDVAVLQRDDHRVLGRRLRRRRPKRAASRKCAAARHAERKLLWFIGIVPGRVRTRIWLTAPSATTAGTKAETSPPIAAIWRTSVAVMGRTDGRGRQEHGLQFRRHRRRSCRPSASRSRDRCRRAGRGSGSVAPCLRAASISQPVEGHDLERDCRPRRVDRRRPTSHQRHALLEGEQRRLAGMDADRDDDPVGDRQRRLEHVEMAVGERVERAGIEGDAVIGSCA